MLAFAVKMTYDPQAGVLTVVLKDTPVSESDEDRPRRDPGLRCRGRRRGVGDSRCLAARDGPGARRVHRGRLSACQRETETAGAWCAGRFVRAPVAGQPAGVSEG